MLGYRLRLAGTKICEQFGSELRGADLLSLWDTDDRDAVGHFVFRAYSRSNRQASFELVLLPLIHTGEAINRVLGAITAIEPPFWLGAEPLSRQEIVEMHLHWPDGAPPPATRSGADVARLARRRFRVFEGGLTGGGE